MKSRKFRRLRLYPRLWLRHVKRRVRNRPRRVVRRAAKRLAKSAYTAMRESRTINQNAKCPACGHRRGHLKFEKEDAAVAHVCHVCAAKWGEDTVIPVEKWL